MSGKVSPPPDLCPQQYELERVGARDEAQRELLLGAGLLGTITADAGEDLEVSQTDCLCVCVCVCVCGVCCVCGAIGRSKEKCVADW